MPLRSLGPAAAIAVLAFAGSAQAQTGFTHPTGGWSVALPKGIAPHPLGGVNKDKGVFVVRRGGSDVGICVASAMPASAVTHEVWSKMVLLYNSDPAGEGRAASERGGHPYLRHLGSRPFTSMANWDGYFFWYERTNSQTQSSQVAVNAATMLGPESRFVTVCMSSKGFSFEAAEIDAIYSFVIHARTS